MERDARAGERQPLADAPAQRAAVARSYQLELPLDLLDEQGCVLDWVIGFAFDTLNVERLDLRIAAENSVA